MLSTTPQRASEDAPARIPTNDGLTGKSKAQLISLLTWLNQDKSISISSETGTVKNLLKRIRDHAAAVEAAAEVSLCPSYKGGSSC